MIKMKKFFLWSAIIFIIISTVGANFIDDRLILKDSPLETDAIICLSGGSRDRLVKNYRTI